MTRKDYKLIAEAINRAWEDCSTRFDEARPVDVTAEFIADALACDNPNFDRERFLEACGL